jgi:predicted nucleic acid-binding protein
LAADKVAEITDEIRAFSKVVAISGALKVVTADPDDDAVFECAILGQAEFIVSGDRHLLNLGSYQSVQIVKAADFLERLQSSPRT